MTIQLALSVLLSISSFGLDKPAPLDDPPSTPSLTDHDGNHLPPGALMRLGSLNLHHEDHISAICFLPDGRHVLSIDSGAKHSPRNEHAKIWDLQTGRFVAGLATRAMNSWVAFSPDGAYMAAMPTKAAIEIWDLVRREKLRTFDRTKLILGTGGKDRVDKLAIEPKGKYLAIANKKLGIVLVDTETGFQLTQIPLKNLYDPMTFSLDGKLFAYSLGNRLGVWNIENSNLFWEKDLGREIGSLAISQNGRELGIAPIPDLCTSLTSRLETISIRP
jgi:WD40 repeat protein